jgi:hypothetical protein
MKACIPITEIILLGKSNVSSKKPKIDKESINLYKFEINKQYHNLLQKLENNKNYILTEVKKLYD